MINLSIYARDGYLYELTSRYNQPQSSAAQLYRSDLYLAERLIAHLPIEPATWLQILARINYRPAALYSYHATSVYKEVATAVMRGDLILYKLPLLDASRSLRGDKDIGLCIIKGPKPHCASHLSPSPIDSPQAAQELLLELGIEAGALLAYLNMHNLYNSYNQTKPLDEVLNRLANKELLAYQIPLPPMSVPEKTVQYAAATGPGYDPVSLGPETKAEPGNSDTKNKSSIAHQDYDKDDCSKKASYGEFCSTVEEFEDDNELAKQAYDLYIDENWPVLEQFFNENKLNGGWPPNRGSISTTEITLPKGTQIDRYGGFIDKNTGQFRDLGTFVSYKGEPFENRALPDETKSKLLKSYVVIKPIPKVNAGKAIPWFNQTGLGTQLETPLSIENLLAKGYLKEV